MILRTLLRSLGLAAKFALVIFIAEHLGIEALGVYGLVVGAAVVSTKVLGIGLSSEVNRLISVGNFGFNDVVRVLRILLSVNLGVVMLAAVVASTVAETNWHLVLAMLLVVASEHLSFEINGFIYSAHMPHAGALLMFVKTGLWSSAAIAGMHFGLVDSVEGVLWLWCGANLAVIVLGTGGLRRRVAGDSSNGGLREVWSSGAWFYAGAILVSLAQYADRFILAQLGEKSDVGIYVLSWSTANTVQTLSAATVGVVAAPALAKWFEHKRPLRDIFFNKWTGRAAGASLLGAFLITSVVFFLPRIGVVSFPVPDAMKVLVLSLAFAIRSILDIVWGGLIASQARRLAVAYALASLVVAAISYYLCLVLLSAALLPWAVLSSSIAAVAISYQLCVDRTAR